MIFTASAYLTLLGETTELIFTVSETGRLEQFRFQRWGNPEGAEHHYVDEEWVCRGGRDVFRLYDSNAITGGLVFWERSL